MGRNAAWLSPKQVGVLLWIRDGRKGSDPATDIGRRITARALQRRGLIGIKGHGDSWTASITKAGLAWLAAHPAAPTSDDVEMDDVEELIRRVQMADGRLVLPADPDVEDAHKRVVELSDRSPSRPRGWRLQMHTVGPWDDSHEEIVLVRCFEDLVDVSPVLLPKTARYHPTVRAYLADRDRQLVSKEHVTRAARILQAIVDEAPRRGLTLRTKQQALIGADRYTSREIGRGHLIVESPAATYSIRVMEVSAPSATRVPPRGWHERRRRAAWLDARRFEFVGTGALELVVEGGGMGYSGTRYRDAKTVSLEAKLPRMFRAIEIHRLYAEEREAERQRADADRQRRWEAAMAEARRRYDEQMRWEAFQKVSRDWREHAWHREFLAAVRVAVMSYSGSHLQAIEAQLDFAEGKLDESDPIRHPELVLPAIPDPNADDLEPFLGGWSPHGAGSAGW